MQPKTIAEQLFFTTVRIPAQRDRAIRLNVTGKSGGS